MKIAVYPTSANPPTFGHADILIRAARLFDKVFWSAADNSDKKYFFQNVKREVLNKSCI